jgi:hypothetical protein
MEIIADLQGDIEIEDLCAICHIETEENVKWPSCSCKAVYHFKCLKQVDKCPTCRKP